MYPEFRIFKLLNVSNKDALSICKSLLGSAINKRNKELQHFSKELSLSKKVLSKQLSTTDFTSLENLYHRITRYCCRNRFTRNKKSYLQWQGIATYLYSQETIINLRQYELSQEESGLLKADLYFSIQPDKIRKSEILTS